MQLEEGLPDSKDITLPPPVRPVRKSLPPLNVRAFGVNLPLHVTSDQYLHDDSYWRLRSIYEPALTAQTLAASIAV